MEACDTIWVDEFGQIIGSDRDYFEVPPHVYGIAADAYRGLQNNHKGQAVLISGESGAGKTESTKKVLSFLAGMGVVASALCAR